MIDGILKPNQSRDEWLDALENRIAESHSELSREEVIERMQHARTDDFPDTVETFSSIAKEQSWKNFHVLVDKGIFAFMVFSKG